MINNIKATYKIHQALKEAKRQMQKLKNLEPKTKTITKFLEEFSAEPYEVEQLSKEDFIIVCTVITKEKRKVIWF